MLTVLSLVTSVKDYIEIAHKLVETQAGNSLLGNNTAEQLGTFFGIKDYTELGSVLTYIVLSIKEFLTSFFTFSWLRNIWSLPLVVPDIASAMISEISVLDSYFTNAFSFLENGLTTSNLNSNLIAAQQNPFIYGFEKFLIGFLNSLFLFLPTSTSHLITLRRFVMQGLEAGYVAGLGTIAGNFLWLSSIILGWRFIVIPWLSLDVFRYVLGFILLVKYLWDSSKELNKTSTRTILEDNTKTKIFVLNFLLALTEQTSIYPFISNLSFGAEGSVLEGFSGSIFQSDNLLQFYAIHGCYLIGILLGSFSLLQFTVWFWENPAFSIYMWMVSSYKVTTSSYYKVVNFVFLYLTMLCAISSIPYFGLDYTITNPLGLIPQDRMIDQKLTTANGPGDKILPETSFLGVNPTDKNSRIRDGVHARRERWKERLMKYQAFDASVYDQGTYDILTVEDLNYGFDRFWLRRKMRNHQIRFRLFPGPWMRSLKKQLNKPGFTGPRVEFFRILFEQYYHPSFHATNAKKSSLTKQSLISGISNKNTPVLTKNSANLATSTLTNTQLETKSLYSLNSSSKANPGISSQSNTNGINNIGIAKKFRTQKNLIYTHQSSALRKFARNFSNRLNTASLSNPNLSLSTQNTSINSDTIYSKSLKSLFNKIDSEYSKEKLNIFRNISKNILMPNNLNNNSNLTILNTKTPIWVPSDTNQSNQISILNKNSSLKTTNIRKKLSKKERLLLTYKTNLLGLNANTENTLTARTSSTKGIVLQSLQPLNFYFQKDEAFKRKLKYYSTTVSRNLTVGNNAPYLKTMLKKAFFYYKPSLRLKRTLFTAAMRRGFRKKSVNPKKLVYPVTIGSEQNLNNTNNSTVLSSTNDMNTGGSIVYPSTTSYSVLGKRASRYRYQIYKDVLQHWYYTPFNRLLLKFDIDSFINRQPKTHFLTKKEERLLHLRRILLAEHYNTLRWYTYMQHYRTMKARIGGTKSFANTVYNQQFQGTFKKIRHLFSVTPSQGDMSVLKFDQVLFNAAPAVNPKLITSNSSSNKTAVIRQDLPQDYIEQSLTITGEYLKSEQQNKVLKIKEYVNQKNYSELTNLLNSNNFGLNTQKTETNTNSVTSDTVFMNKNRAEQFETKEILFQLLKECKRRLNDQSFLKNYVNHRIDKREQRNSDTEKELKVSLDNLKTWLSPISINIASSTNAVTQNNSLKTEPTGLRKALNEGVFALNNINPAMSSKTILLNKTVPLKLNQIVLNKMNLASEKEKLHSTLTLNSIKTLTDKITTWEKQFNKKAKYKNLKKAETTRSLAIVKSTINTVLKPLLVLQNRILVKRSEKNLEWWRQKQRAMSKRQSSRKKGRFKTIQTNIAEQNKKIRTSTYLRFAEQIDSLGISSFNASSVLLSSSYAANNNSEQLRKKLDNSEQNSSLNIKQESTGFRKIFEKLFIKKFRKKASSKGRRYRVFATRTNSASARGFAYIKKPKKANGYFGIQDINGQDIPLSNLDTSSSYADSKYLLADSTQAKKTLLKDVKAKLVSVTAKSLTSGSDSSKGQVLKDKAKNLKLRFAPQIDLLIQTNIKKSPTKKNTLAKRTIKRRKRHKFTRNLQRYRKRQHQGFGKLRMLSKKIQRIKSTIELRNWWWNNYLPSYIQKNSINTTALSNKQSSLNNSYKPLSTNKALEIANNSSTKYGAQSTTPSMFSGPELSKTSIQKPLQTSDLESLTVNQIKSTSNNTLVDQIYLDLLTNNPNSVNPNNFNLLKTMYSTTNIPFYAGWDESLRKFVVTNRLLSRRDTGFEVSFDSILLPNKKETTVNNKLEFTKAPLQGLNEGSFLYLQNAEQLPFNAYNIDQFIPNNQSFYAPLGWKRFEFRHSLLKNWLAGSDKASAQDMNSTANIFLKPYSLSNLEFFNSNYINQNQNKINGLAVNQYKTTKALQNRRIKKRYKLLKQTPIQLMYVPTGALLTEVLPSHYISVFDKQYRFPRNRYLKRNLLKSSVQSAMLKQNPLYTKDLTVLEYSNLRFAEQIAINNSSMQNAIQAPDFTLRKRIKPRRKYHKKRFTKKDSLIFPRRYKFGIAAPEYQTSTRFAPQISRFAWDTQIEKAGTNVNSIETKGMNTEGIATQTFRLRPSSTTKQTAMNKSKSKKRVPKANPVRLRQLRRREFQQVYKPLQRFQPRYGGFVWPGDYLRLDVIPMPKLQSLKSAALNQLTQNAISQDLEQRGAGSTAANAAISTKVKRTTKINVQPVGLLPRKYLIQKHNLKVLRKKLALSQKY